MQVHTDTGRLPAFRNAVITIGTFDGVHLGHQKIISQLKQHAAETGGETVIVTFHPHPRMVVNGATKKIKLITTISERTRLLEARGIDHLVVVPFTKAFSELSPREYVEDFLIGKFQPAAVIIGYDHRFGRGRHGDYKLLEEYSTTGRFQLREIPRQVINDSAVSSTLIRASLEEGDTDRANSLLGYDFFFEAEVVQGDRRGRTIGFPTANLLIGDDEKIVPGNGVYAVTAAIEGYPDRPTLEKQTLYGMMNIGTRPTVGGTERTIEVHLFNFSADIYGKRMRVGIRKFLRKEKRFSGLSELKRQLAEDERQSKRVFSG